MPAGGGGGARGGNAEQFGWAPCVARRTAPLRGGGGAGGAGDGGGAGERAVGTLLGPEGTGRPCRGWGVSSGERSFWCRTARVAGVWRCRVGGHLPYFENCTVDASI